MADDLRITADTYTVLAAPREARIKEKGSVFLAYADPIADPAAGDARLANLWKAHHDATHIGWARRTVRAQDPDTLPDGAIAAGRADDLLIDESWSDDGEPSGSTGPPILHAIQGTGMVNVQVAVVRWFGGTKLGVGGLVRAYGGAAADALAGARPETVLRSRTLHIEVPHALAGAVYALADREKLKVGSPDYTETGLIIPVDVPLSQIDAVEPEITEVTAGRAVVQR